MRTFARSVCERTRLGAGLAGARARRHPRDPARLSVESQQSDRLGPDAGGHATHRRSLRTDRNLAAGRRGLSGRRDRWSENEKLLGHERPRDRHQRAVEGVRHPGCPDRMDCRSAAAGRSVLESARLHHDRSRTALGSCRPFRGRARESGTMLREHGRAAADTTSRSCATGSSSFGGRLTWTEPRAGAIGLMKYAADTPSLTIADRIRVGQSTLIVPGSQVGRGGTHPGLARWPGTLSEGRSAPDRRRIDGSVRLSVNPAPDPPY